MVQTSVTGRLVKTEQNVMFLMMRRNVAAHKCENVVVNSVRGR